MNLVNETDIAQGFRDVIANYIIPVICLVSVVWAIWIGIQFALAHDATKRQNAKKRFMNALGTVMIFILMTSAIMGINFSFRSTSYVPLAPEQPEYVGDSDRWANYIPPMSSSALPTGVRKVVGYDVVSPVLYSWGVEQATGAYIVNGNYATNVEKVLSNPSVTDVIDTHHHNPATNMALQTAVKPTTNKLIAESITSVYGMRRIFTNDDTKYTEGSKAPLKGKTMDIERLKAGELPYSTFSVSNGMNEDFFGIELNTMEGEGLAKISTATMFSYLPKQIDLFEPMTTAPGVYTTPAQGTFSAGTIPSAIAGKSSLIGVGAKVGFEPIDILGDVRGPLAESKATPAPKFDLSSMTRSTAKRFDGMLKQDMVSLWQNPNMLEAQWQTNPLNDGRRVMSEARAVADGWVVAAGNTETDSPYDLAWVVIKHFKPLPGQLETYSFYGGLYGAVKMDDNLVQVYNTNPNDYEIVRSQQPIAGYIAQDVPFIDLAGENFGPGYFEYDGVIFEAPYDMTGSPVSHTARYQISNNDVIGTPRANRQAECIAYDAAHPPVPTPTPDTAANRAKPALVGGTRRLLTNDVTLESCLPGLDGSYGSYGGYVNALYDPSRKNAYKGSRPFSTLLPAEKYAEFFGMPRNPLVADDWTTPSYWYPTTVFNKSGRLDYNDFNYNAGFAVPYTGVADTMTGFYSGHGTYDQNLIGRPVKQGEFIGYIGGGLLDPGAGQRHGSKYELECKEWQDIFSLPQEIRDLYDTLETTINALTAPIEDINDVFKGVGNAIDASMPSASQADKDKAKEDFAEKSGLPLDGINVPNASTILPRKIIELPNFPVPDIFPGVNSFTLRHLEFRMYGRGAEDYQSYYFGDKLNPIKIAWGETYQGVNKVFEAMYKPAGVSGITVEMEHTYFATASNGGIDPVSLVIWLSTWDDVLQPGKDQKKYFGNTIWPLTYYQCLSDTRGRPTVALDISAIPPITGEQVLTTMHRVKRLLEAERINVVCLRSNVDDYWRNDKNYLSIAGIPPTIIGTPFISPGNLYCDAYYPITTIPGTEHTIFNAIMAELTANPKIGGMAGTLDLVSKPVNNTGMDDTGGSGSNIFIWRHLVPTQNKAYMAYNTKTLETFMATFPSINASGDDVVATARAMMVVYKENTDMLKYAQDGDYGDEKSRPAISKIYNGEILWPKSAQLDCSSFVRWCFARAKGWNVGSNTQMMISGAVLTEPLQAGDNNGMKHYMRMLLPSETPQIGDLIFWYHPLSIHATKVYHVGIYTGYGNTSKPMVIQMGKHGINELEVDKMTSSYKNPLVFYQYWRVM